jgi:Pyruvate/2-oxoacid:ferredoxin oxidoreductase delta subunit
MIARIDAAGGDRMAGCPVSRVCPGGAVHLIPSGENAGAWTVGPARCSGCVRVCPRRVVDMVEE